MSWYYVLIKENVKEYIECEIPYLKNFEKENNFISCIEGYYLENNSCVKL